MQKVVVVLVDDNFIYIKIVDKLMEEQQDAKERIS